MSLRRQNETTGAARRAGSDAHQALRVGAARSVPKLGPGSYGAIIDHAQPFGDDGSICDGRIQSNGAAFDLIFTDVVCEAVLEYGDAATLVLGQGDAAHLVAGGGGDSVADTNNYYNTYNFGAVFTDE